MEQRLRDVPASVNVLTQEDIRRSPAVVADDVLRQIPTFSLFRRTSSLASHPTAQGVSLRGIGPSGVSRTLVLLDGVPFNDPFGGWVYWTRVPLDSTDRIEVVDSVELEPVRQLRDGRRHQRHDRRRRCGGPSTSRRSTGTAAAPRWTSAPATSGARSAWCSTARRIRPTAIPSSWKSTPPASPERGLVDKNASVEFRKFNLKAEYAASDNVRAFVRGGHFREERINGKASTIDGTDEKNDTSWTSVNGGVRAGAGRAAATSRRGVHRLRDVPQQLPRGAGGDPAAQHRPDDAESARAQQAPSAAWRSGRARSAARQLFRVGTDWRWVDGDSEEDGLDAATGTQVTLKRIRAGRSAASACSCRT